jgi:hypothetical protein
VQALFQSFNKYLIQGVGIEEICHVELIATTIARLLEGAPGYNGDKFDTPGKGRTPKALETLGIDWGKVLPVPKFDSTQFPEVRELLDAGIGREQYRYPIPMAPERREEFAPGLDPELQEMADALADFKEKQLAPTKNGKPKKTTKKK